MSKLMRILVCFDLPVTTKKERREATRFRNFLLKEGHHMIQFSIYGKICAGLDSVAFQRERIKNALPPSGSVRMLVVTERQYEQFEILLGEPAPMEEYHGIQQLMLF